jgi:hypothetical protein
MFYKDEHTDRRTDMTNLNVAFRNFGKTSANQIINRKAQHIFLIGRKQLHI